MTIDKQDLSPEGEGNKEEKVVLVVGEHTHVIQATAATTEKAGQEVAQAALEILTGKPIEKSILADPLAEPMTRAQIEAKWNSFGKGMAIPLSDSTISGFIEREIAKRMQRGTLLEE